MSGVIYRFESAAKMVVAPGKSVTYAAASVRLETGTYEFTWHGETLPYPGCADVEIRIGSCTISGASGIIKIGFLATTLTITVTIRSYDTGDAEYGPFVLEISETE